MIYDVIIVGGGPAGLSAALALGRARKRVLLCDAGARRNAAAQQIHNFVTRDGTPPDEFRATARAQLATYPAVELRPERVESISGARGAFHIDLASGRVQARRVVLCNGMIDEMLPVEGFRELWGHAIFQCPYCHAWELQDRPWGYLLRPEDGHMLLHFALQARGWTSELTVFTNGAIDLAQETRATLERAGIQLQTSPIARLAARENRLAAVVLANGQAVTCEVLFAHPPQQHVGLVLELGLALDEQGYVQVAPTTRETSRAGIYAAGDLTSRMQGAIFAAAAGTHAAAMLNAELTAEMVLSGAL
jgi:thioredoxin reductase